MPTLKNRTCVFAGATGDISRKAVELLLKGGMNVVLMTHNPQTANEIINEYADLEGRCIAISNQKERKEIFRDISERFGSIDVFISKTGQLEKPVDLEEVSAEDLNKTFTHQVCDVFEGIKDALPYLKKSQNGRIILFSNIGSLNGFPQENIVDNIVRASVNSMVLSLSRQFAKDGITVNAVCFSGLIQDHA